MARMLEARNHHANHSAATMVGTTITNMTASELSRIVRLPAPTGPCGSSTPPAQPASSAVPSKRMVRPDEPARFMFVPMVGDHIVTRLRFVRGHRPRAETMRIDAKSAPSATASTCSEKDRIRRRISCLSGFKCGTDKPPVRGKPNIQGPNLFPGIYARQRQRLAELVCSP